jgi:hypothetical protein
MTERKDDEGRTELSAERMELIRRFMSATPEGESDTVAAVTPLRPRVEQRAAAKPERPLPIEVAPVEVAPERPVVAPAAPVAVVARAPRPAAVIQPRPTGSRGREGLVMLLRGFPEIGWLAAAVILSLVIVLLLAHPG